ncbi:MAG: DUF3108 domain-containing protein [Desulfocapsa sp.]|nr:DUF3108 domain-containing protein [Desulfocapsa sp.]
MSRLFFFPAFIFVLLNFISVSNASSHHDGEILNDVVDAMYTGGEKLVYNISWTGGIKIGELRMEVSKVQNRENVYELKAQVKDSGLFHFFYPVDDSFITLVKGEKRLPISYDVIQKEGQGYKAKRFTKYDQDEGEILYRKNEKDPIVYTVDGEVHNEFSSFFFSRILNFQKNQKNMVPTFADGKRHEVLVHVGDETVIKNTILGDVNVFPVKPIMKFKGLYDKDGDTVIWLTNNSCRIPVRINSKILIGSLTAELVSYTNPHCSEMSEYDASLHDVKPNQEIFELGD